MTSGQSASLNSRTFELTLLPDRLSAIDETTRGQHIYLSDDDRCYYFGEYFAYKGYQGGSTNQLILNFKIKPSELLRNPARRHYKEGAINTIKTALGRTVGSQSLQKYTWTPIPPSKVAGHPDHDDRVLRTLSLAFPDIAMDVRPLLHQVESTEGDHAGNRIAPADLSAILAVDRDLLRSKPLREGIALFDDVVTTGKHFVCCKQALRRAGVDVPIIGVFVARRILHAASVDDFEDPASD